jgi:hypothetical protein
VEELPMWKNVQQPDYAQIFGMDESGKYHSRKTRD